MNSAGRRGSRDRGGIWGKWGDRYEARWTIRFLLDVIEGQAEAVWLERISEEEGFEFRVDRGGSAEFHQVKRQTPAVGGWTISELKSVIEDFGKRLRSDPNAVCVFASTVSVNDLRTLRQQSDLAISEQEFVERLSEHLKPSATRLATYWGTTVGETWPLLKRIRLATIEEPELLELVKARLGVLVDREDAVAARSVLFEYVFERVGQRVSRDEIVSALEEANIRLVSPAPAIAQRVRELQAVFSGELGALSIPDVQIDRSEAAAVVQQIEEGRHLILLTGDAGIGKSQVLRAVVQECDERRWAWLPVRVDRLGNALTSIEIGQQLGLTQSPVTIVLNTAGDRKVLVIDQLDAISVTSGRQLATYDAIRELLYEAQIHPQVQVVVSCRNFDLETDNRLRGLIAGDDTFEVSVQPLSEQTVRATVSALGFSAERLRRDQIEVLSSPFHLYLLSQVRTDSAARELAFTTPKDLLDLYWTEKERACRLRVGDKVAWTSVIDVLIEYLSRERRLSAPNYIVDDQRQTVDAMASENVLVIRDARVAFFHESFFDYAFARRFFRKYDGVVQFLQSTDQELFRRWQVRSVLLYLHDTERERYFSEMLGVLVAPNVRFHVKHVVASLIAAIDEPTESEWVRIAPHLSGEKTPLSDRLVRMVRDAPNWQDYLLANGWLEKNLAGSPSHQERAINIAISLQRRRPDLVAPLLSRHVHDVDPWPTALRAIVGFGSGIGQDRAYFESVLGLLRAGVLEGSPIGFFRMDSWSLGHGLERERPGWACEFIAAHLKRQIEAHGGRLDPEDLKSAHGAAQLIVGAAEAAPSEFARLVTPLMLQLMRANVVRSRRWAFKKDSLWRFRTTGPTFSPTAAILRGMEKALVAIVGDKQFDQLARKLLRGKYETGNYLVGLAYCAALPSRGDEAIQFLIAVPDRLVLDIDGRACAAAETIVRRFLGEASPPTRRSLVQAILRYTNGVKNEKEKAWRTRVQHRLLAAAPRKGIGAPAAARLSALDRDYGPQSAREAGPEPDDQSWEVVSPIAPDTLAHMSDDDWIERITTEPDSEYWLPSGRLMGGAYEVANLFEKQFESDPRRFAALLLRLPETVRTVYVDAGIRGCAKQVGALDDQTVWGVVRKCHALPGHPVGRWLLWLVQAAAAREIPTDILDAVIWYAKNDPDPVDREGPIRAGDGSPRLLDSGINTTRGSASEALAEVLRRHPDALDPMRSAVETLARDPSAAVQSCAARLLAVVIGIEVELAFELIPDLARDPAVLGTQYGRGLLLQAARTAYGRIGAVVESLAVSGIDDAEFAAGEVKAFNALLIGADIDELTGHVSAAVRRGTAVVLASNIPVAAYAETCRRGLVKLFSDSDASVREAASRCFWQLSAYAVAQERELCIAFVNSPSYAAYSHHLLRKIAESPDVPADVVAMAAERFIKTFGREAGDIRTGASADASEVSVMLIRAYSQTPSDLVREQALNAIDEMLEAGAFGVEQSLEAFRR